MISPLPLLAYPVMSSWPWRRRIICGGVFWGRLLVLAPVAAVPPPVPLVLLPCSSRLPAPLDRVGERGALASRFIAARRGLPRAGGGGEGVACFVGEGGNECVDFVDVLPIG